MPTRVHNDVIEQYDAPMPASYWRKNKKCSVNLNESSFATERQLEDQRWLREKNRNPQGELVMKCDKLKSARAPPKLAANPIKMKTNVLNKIVREASGVFNYTLVPPINAQRVKAKGAIDPDTCPLVAAYRKESNSIPHTVSFGHRPSSASRTFHPGTMRIRLKHGEVVQSAPRGKSGFGLSVAVLQQLLRAPRVARPGEEAGEEQHSLTQDHSSQFSEGIPMRQLSSDGSLVGTRIDELARSKSGDSGQQISRIRFSGIEQDGDDFCFVSDQPDVSSTSRKQRNKIKQKAKSDVSAAQWNESFHMIKRNANEKFLLRSSGTKLSELYTLEERLKRFKLKAAVVEPDSGCCNSKRELDRTINLPKSLLLPKLKQRRETNADPRVDQTIEEMKRHYESQRAKREHKDREMLFRDALTTIPDVSYYPASLHSSIKIGEVDLNDITKAQLSARSQLSDMTFSVAEGYEGRYYDEATPKGGAQLVAKDSFASITSGPYSLGLLATDTKEKSGVERKKKMGPLSPKKLKQVLKDRDFMILDGVLKLQAEDAFSSTESAGSKTISDRDKNELTEELEGVEGIQGALDAYSSLPLDAAVDVGNLVGDE